VTASNSIPRFLTMPSAATLSALTLTTGALKAFQNNPLKQYGFTNRITAAGARRNSKYNGLVLQVTKRYSRNFSYLAAYTWSHLMDDSTADINFTALTPRRPQNFGNLSKRMGQLYSRSAPSPDHHADLRYQARSRGVAGPEKSDGQLESRVYLHVLVAGVRHGAEPIGCQSECDNQTDRAIVNPNGVAGTGSGVQGYDRNSNPVGSSSSAIVAYVATKPQRKVHRGGFGAPYANGRRNTMPFRLAIE